MNNAWGDSWGNAWADGSWGAGAAPVVVDQALDGAGVHTIIVNKARDWEKEERERIEARIAAAKKEFTDKQEKKKKPARRVPLVHIEPVVELPLPPRPVVVAPAANDPELEEFMLMLIAEAA